MNEKNEPEITNSKKSYNDNIVKAVFVTSLAGISALFSFSYALGSTKKRDINNNPSLQTYESGLQLALKALKYGTLYAFTGCGIICFGVWKLSGAKDSQDFRNKMGSLFPKIPKQHPQGRCDFESVTDLFQYLDDEYSSNKAIQNLEEHNN